MNMSHADELKERARAAIDTAHVSLVELSERLHANPELAFEEHRASEWLCEALDGAGFAVTRPLADLPTAFGARHGEGALHLGLCIEYDALPTVGHACGHNLIATMSLGAALGLAACADDAGVTVRALGTPAEEGGCGKAIMLARGAFDGVHAAMLVHPAPYEVPAPELIAMANWRVRYHGRSAHAAAFPQQGINAADALTVAQVAIGLLRQHLPPAARVHGIVVEGGEQANLVPAETEASFYLRAPTREQLADVEQRIRACFEAGALATGAQLEIDEVSPAYADMRPDAELLDRYVANATRLGRRFDDDARAAEMSASSDMGNVSHALPSIQPTISVESLPAVNHQQGFADACIGPIAERALRDGAVVMAWTAIDAALDPELRARLLAGPPPS